MIRKLLLLGGLTLALALALVAGGTPTTAAPGDVQEFDVDIALCQLPSYPPDTISPNPQAGPYQVCGVGEGKAINGAPGDADATSTAIGLIGGNRLGYPYVYNGPGWVVQNDAAITDGTQVGDVASATDLYQDGTTDLLGDISNCGGPPNNCPAGTNLSTIIPDQYVERTTAWGLGTGCVGEDEGYLSDVMPGASAMTRHVRYRACLDTLFLQGQFRVDLIAVAGAPTPLNLVTMDPVWSPAGTLVNLVLLSGAADSPGTGLTGIDSPQASISHTLANAAANPAVPGLYARWVTEISAQDEQSRDINLVLTTNCKAIGGAQTDADADCWEDPASGGADTNTANDDQDGDGLLDGIEVAWGSNPNNANSDGDSRSDLEEMIGPTQFLTNPLVADTDGDGKNDGGLKLDGADGGLAPDFPDEDGDGAIDAGKSGNLDISGDGSSHRRMGWKIIGEDIEADGAGADNCPSLANNAGPSAQKNRDYDSLTEHGNGDLYGDACDGDDDQDEIVDDAELTFQWDSGSHTCSNDLKLPGAATQLDPLDLDTDDDGVMDGVECLRGSNPNDAGDTPGRDATDADNDAVGATPGLGTSFEVYQRSFSFSGGASEDFDTDTLIGDNDPDSDGDGLSDGCEAFVTGTSLASTNTDTDGTPDAAETNVVALAGLYCLPNVADPVITQNITGAHAVITRTVAGAVADDVELTFTEPGGVNIVSVEAGGGQSPGQSTCPAAAGVEAPAGTWTVTWPGPCVANGQNIRVLVGYTGPSAPTPTMTGVTWTLGGVPIGAAQPGVAVVLRAEASFTRTVAGAAADDLRLTFAAGAGIVRVSAGDGTSSCPMRAGVEAPPGTWTVTWSPACVANGQSIRIVVEFTTALPTLTGVTWTLGGVPIGGPEPGPFPMLRIKSADDAELTINVPVGTTLRLVAAGDATSQCPWAIGWRIAAGPPEVWRVKWPFKCVGNGMTVRVLMLYRGAAAPTITNVRWSDGAGLKFGPDPQTPANVLSVATATDVDGDTVLNGADNCPWVPNLDQANTDIKIGNGKGIAGDDGTVPWSTLADKRGDACDGDLDGDGISESTDLNSAASEPGVWPDITYDDDLDGSWKDPEDDGTLWDGDPMNAKLDGREALCPAGVPTTDGDGDGLSDRIEYCKWGSSPIKVDSDGNGKGDCNEIVDTNGDGQANLSDVVNGAKAALLGDAVFGKDGDFDINGDNAVNISDVTIMAQKALITGSCK